MPYPLKIRPWHYGDFHLIYRLGELDTENNKLKKLLAEKLIENKALKDVVSKKVVKPADRKPIAEHLIKTYQLSERKACDLSGISRTGFRYQPQVANDEPLRQRLKSLANQYPRYGYLLLHTCCSKRGWSLTRSTRIACIPRKTYK